MAHSFTTADLAQLEARGISLEKAEKQLQSFATGFPELDIVSAASVGNGVLNPSEEEIDAYLFLCVLFPLFLMFILPKK